ncbi:hypothetical protein O181_001983 [Austropuccinia psidii MF-1]|uniref:Uncharacterized protein n=1 Tax=Austropuccinia psidii MF-1 TaxID=1389203 RepID=A0A9Q3BBV9_9BASI|nr:hypothetical protein [Austropuccinia psidii MF-1]
MISPTQMQKMLCLSGLAQKHPGCSQIEQISGHNNERNLLFRYAFTAALTQPYTHIVPSRHTPNTPITPPYTSSHQPNPQSHLPSLCSCSALKM